MDYTWRLGSSQAVRLADHDSGFRAGLERDDVPPLIGPLRAELEELQAICFAAEQHAVLVVLQGMDASGKDETIMPLLSGLDPQGCRVAAFKEPTSDEKRHDFLWRFHAATSPKGIITVFNRSHYEEVLIARVAEEVSEAVWRGRYELINDFEKLLARTDTIILKFFLHVSEEVQSERLRSREEQEDERWQLSAQDFVNQGLWDEYGRAYEDLLERCSTSHAPWHVVPADHDWFRDLAVTRAVVEGLRPYRAAWQEGRLARGRANYEEVLAARGGDTEDG